MGITLVSNTMPANANTTASATPAGDALPVDFALLLGDVAQMLTAASQPGAVTESPGNAPVRDRKADPADPLAASDDNNLIPFIMAGIDTAPLRPQAKPTIESDTSSREKPGLALGALIGNSRPKDDRNDRGLTLGDRGAKAPGLALGTLPGTAPAALEKPAAADGAAANFAAELSNTDHSASFAAALATQQGNAAPKADDKGIANLPPIATPVAEPGWDHDLGNRIVWMTRNEQQTAQISLNPPQLGPLQITVNVSGDQASAIFTSPHAEVRQAIEDAMPRLREMLSSAGIDLGQTNVGAQAQQQGNGNQPQAASNPRFAGDNAILPSIGAPGGASPLPALMQRGRGLVDLFA